MGRYQIIDTSFSEALQQIAGTDRCGAMRSKIFCRSSFRPSHRKFRGLTPSQLSLSPFAIVFLLSRFCWQLRCVTVECRLSEYPVRQ